MRICRVSQTWPTRSNEGKGLHAYFISNALKYPTLVLTKLYASEEYLPAEKHVDLQIIDYLQYPFPDARSKVFSFLLAMITYAIGQLQFFLKSLIKIVKFKPTIVHLQSPHGFLIGLFSKFILGCSVVVTFHGSDLKRVGNNYVFMSILKLFDGFFYVSKDMKNILLDYYPEKKLLHTPSGVDLSFFKDDFSTTRDAILLAVGNIRWQKNYSMMIKAFAIVIKKLPHYKLFIVGQGKAENIEKLKSEIVMEGVKDKVFLLGYKNRDEIINYYRNAKLLLLSSITEGMPKVIHEALASGLPVVATDVGACSDIIGNAGLVVENEREDLFADGIISILVDPSEYDMLVQNTNGKADGYSWVANAENIEYFFIENLRV